VVLGLARVFAEENEEKNIKATDLMELAKPHAPNQLSESGVAADRIEVWMGLEELQDIRLLLVSLLEPGEGLFVVTEAKVSIHKCTRGNVAFLAASFHFREEPECIAAPTGVGVRSDQDARILFWGVPAERSYCGQ
jgi:hypothetical protein